MEQPIANADGQTSLPQPTLNPNLGLLRHAAESRELALPSADSLLTLSGRQSRDVRLPIYTPPWGNARDNSQPFYYDNRDAELAPIKPPADTQDGVGTRGEKRSSSQISHQTLPSLSSITAPSVSPTSSTSPPAVQQSTGTPQRLPETSFSPPAPTSAAHWPSLNPLTAYYTPSHVHNPEPPMKMDTDTSSNSTLSAASPDRSPMNLDSLASLAIRSNERASSVSIDDPDVRIAAEALSNLQANFVPSPIYRSTRSRSPRYFNRGQQPEPLLSLLTTSHPFLATTIDSATSAYTNSKNYYPRIKTSIEYVEGYVIPLANTVGSVGRVTGVENGVRWFLRRSRTHSDDLEGQGSHKRRRVGPGNDDYWNEAMASDYDARTPRASFDESHERRLSITSTVDTLPPYDEFRSPPYSEHPGADGRPDGAAWHSRLMMTTSGLSIAMSEESLRSLKFCLSWLRWANEHIGQVVHTMNITLEKYEQSGPRSDGDETMQGSSQEAEDRSYLAAQLQSLRSDVLKTLQGAISTVSRYAGGALPENARELVRRHLKSLPQRFYMANRANSREASWQRDASIEEGQREQEQQQEAAMQESKSTRRVLVLAKEGLDMMSQVSGVLNTTIVSAEEWCERLGKQKHEQREEMRNGSHSQSADDKSDDTNMPDSNSGHANLIDSKPGQIV